MLEQTDKKDEEEYIWAMKSGILNEDENWKNRRATPLAELHSLARRATFAGKTVPFWQESHTRTMASLVPDEIIYNISDYSKREFDACLLFGDVSGFTDLCEKYNKSGKGGPSRITQVLNNYIGAMVQEILSHSGDVLKFSGDAFIAMWKENDHLSLRDAVHEAIDCALVIQKTYGTYQTDVDVVVRVKLAVASGHLVFSLVGDEENSHYLMTGQPIYDIKSAEAKSQAGEIVITARVSHHISANEYLINLLADGMHAKILGVGPNWRNIQRHYENKTDMDTFSILSATSVNVDMSLQDVISIPEVSKKTSVEKEKDEDAQISSHIANDQYALRPAVNYAARIKLREELRKFIIAPVVRGIEANEPLEYLTEIRQVVILFINCKTSGTATAVEGIDVGNEVYITVCSVVKNRYGCVNKISNFDKDLMLLVIFGLRGFKHELESQIALKCAVECYEKLSGMEEILGTAAAVTTGKCYCGAFGHTLRREYTVIGLVVNKAARLMMAYPNRVTCDRETFLHSKLEARNFLLLEYKPLKGIVNPGPIYEFKEVEKSDEEALYVNPLPLLGREQEIDFYKTLLEKAVKLSQQQSDVLFYNMLILQGVYRQGKSRLLEEILYFTDPDIPTQKFTLSKFDYEIPYRTVRMIFARHIGMSPQTSTSQKQQRIRSRLRDHGVNQHLCLLNAVFDLDYEITPEYNAMDKRTKYKTLQKIFKILCQEIFNKFWVIAIDDSEHIDDESWLLIKDLLDLNLMFIVATMGTEKEISTLALHVLKNPKIKSIELKGIDKWYHIGLACQMLTVDGIPPELEKIIQLKSNGNPGWVESFLISLRQSGGLRIQEINRQTAYDTGIVMPPLYMTMRLSSSEIKLWVEIMEERKFSTKEDAIATRWKMFIDCCRESFPDLTVAKSFQDKVKNSDTVNICTVNEDFNLDDVDPELVIDVIILKTFDALTSYEQLLLKCSAILGDTFPRDMLVYIMSSSAVRLTALAVQKLFEIQVLSCAKGNFIEDSLSFKERLVNPNEDMSVKCDCKGLIIHESCTDLPKYASCGYLRFRSSVFRETTYNLLTENQKREFHEKAIRYLEKETRRCRACGNGYFVRLMGQGKCDITLRAFRAGRKRRSMVTETSSVTDSFGYSKILQRSSFLSFESMASSKSKEGVRPRDVMSIFSTTSSAGETLSLPDSHHIISLDAEIGLTAVRKLKDNYNLTRTFSLSDFTQCTCLLILSTMYSQLIEHCKGAGLVEKIMNATVEYTYICCECKNIPQALKILEEALVLLDGPMKDQIELDWMVDLKRGKLLALLGKARMALGDDECYHYFIKALKCYGITFPKTFAGKQLLKCRYKLKQLIKLYLYKSVFSKTVDEDVADYCNNVSEVLSFLCDYFMKKSMWNEAELAAVWSLTKVLETETDFEKLCIAYANLIYVCATIGKHKFCVALEVFSLRTCHKKKTHVELEELKAVSWLYFCISRSRMRRAEVEKFIHIGYVGWRVSASSQNDVIVFRLLPLLSYVVLMRRQIMEFGNLLQEIRYLVEQDVDSSEWAWYYSLCLILHLETGLIAEPTSKCIRFLHTDGLERMTRDPKGRNRLIVVLWLWEVRNENWEAAVVWEKSAWSFSGDVAQSSANLITGMYLLEGLIIYMVGKMDRKNMKAVAKANTMIHHMFVQLTRATKYSRVLSARLYHMKAYYKIAKYNDYKSALHLLKLARKKAEQSTYELELSWIKHSELGWCRKLSREDAEFWREHTDEDNQLDYRDVESRESFKQYTLPVPLYI